MYVIDIVKEYLTAHGYDGLWNADGECACETACLEPCEHLSAECEAGYRAPCDCGEHDWHIVAAKPTTDPAVLDRLTAKLIEGMKAEAADAKPPCEKCNGTKRVKCERWRTDCGFIAPESRSSRRCRCPTGARPDYTDVENCTVPCNCAKGEGR